MRYSTQIRTVAARVLAPAVWLTGALATALAMAGPEPLEGLARLGIATALVLFLLVPTLRWRAVPIVFSLAGMLSPVIASMALFAARERLGLWGVWVSSWYESQDERHFQATFFAAILLASPVLTITALGDGGLARLRGIARRALPLVAISVAILTTLALVRYARYPVPGRWAESLPMHAQTPPSEGVACEPILSNGHQPSWDVGSCETAEVDATPLAFHYHCLEKDGKRTCQLYFRFNHGPEQEAWLIAPGATIYHDDVLGIYVSPRGSGRIEVFGEDRVWPSMSDLHDRIAPPLGWIIAAICGLAFAALASLTWRAVRRLADAQRASAFVERLRGDLAIVSTAVLLTTGAYLFTALAVGLLTPR